MKNHLLCTMFLLVTIWAFAQDYEVYNGCPMEGKVSPNNAPQRSLELENLNRLKNRYRFPRPEDFDNSVTLEKMIGKPGEGDRDKFDQRKAATIEGYIVYAAKRGSKETCNCHATSTYFTDQHIELALTPDEPKEGQTIVVEITPRVRELMMQQGIDWTHGEIQKYKGYKVRVSGWLFYDGEHEKDACSYNPAKCGDAPGYNRHTAWEIHPVTSFEVITDEYLLAYGDDDDERQVYKASAPLSYRISSHTNENNAPMDPNKFLVLILLGGIIGTTGQMIRVIIGLKKAADENKVTDYKRMVLTLVLAFAVGGVAGVLAAIESADTTFDKSTVIAFLAAGYAGTDFIEGFIKKNKVGEKSKP